MKSLMTLNTHTNNDNYVIIACLKSERRSKLINRIPGSRLLISSLPGSALRMLVEIAWLAERFNKHSLGLENAC